MPWWRQKLRNICWKGFNRLENNGDSDFSRNGEKAFIDTLIDVFVKEPNKERVIFDIGANVGEYSQMLTQRIHSKGISCSLHLFEPTKACFAELQNRFAGTAAIRLNAFGLSDQEEKRQIFYDKEKSGLASLYKRNLQHYNIEMEAAEEIVLETAVNYIEKAGIGHIDFVKIDIEGHELNAFKGFGKYLNAQFIDFVQFEYGGANLDSHTSLLELFRFFEARGFILAKIMPKGLEIRNYSPMMENFVYANYVAVSGLLKR